jgi:membrane protein DedA with SNARE-associated domain
MAIWITEIMTTLGYLGIGLLMFLENLFPPIPSELIMPLAGFTVAQGEMQLIPAILAGVSGTVLGALPWYYIGKLISETRLADWIDRYGGWLGLSAKDIHRAKAWFDRHGSQAVFFGRLVPGVRTLISLPAGIDAMPLQPFLLYSTAGTLIWTTFLTLAGYFLGENYSLVEQYLGPIAKFVLLALGLGFVVWLGLRHLKRQR